MDDVATDILDAFLDQLAWPVPLVQRCRKQLAQRGIPAQYFNVLGIQLVTACPFPYFNT